MKFLTYQFLEILVGYFVAHLISNLQTTAITQSVSGITKTLTLDALARACP